MNTFGMTDKSKNNKILWYTLNEEYLKFNTFSDNCFQENTNLIQTKKLKSQHIFHFSSSFHIQPIQFFPCSTFYNTFTRNSL